MKDADIHTFLTELYKAGQQNDAREQERRKKMLNLEPESAQFLSILIRSSRRTRLIEIGTSNGYSTIWFAWAASAADGHIVSIDRDADKQTLAEANLRRVGLRERVELICDDATKAVANLSGPFDCVFFDADRFSAASQLAQLIPKLTQDAFIFADNVLSHPEEIAGYLAALNALPQFKHMIVPIGKGLSIAYRWNET